MPLRRYTLTVLSTVLVVCCAAWQADDPARSKKTPGSRNAAAGSRPARNPLEAVLALQLELPRTEMDELPFDEFVAWLARQSGVNVVPNWKALEKAGVERERAITLSLENATLAEILSTVLSQIESQDKPLGYRARDNIVTISTRADLDRFLVTRTYDVQHLQVIVPNFGSLPFRKSRIAARQPEGPDGLKTADDLVRQIVDVITSSVYPDTWRVNGGAGTISYFKGKLIIRNTPEVHDILSGGLRVIGPKR